MTMGRERVSLPAWLALAVVFGGMAVAGTMECDDYQKAQEFRQETRVVTDDRGEPQLVDARTCDRQVLEMYGYGEGQGNGKKTAETRGK